MPLSVPSAGSAVLPTVLAQGAKCDAVIKTDGAMTNGQPTLTSASSAFTSADVGKRVYVVGAFSSARVLAATILTVNSATSVTLDKNAQTTATATRFVYGTDDTVALQACATIGGTWLLPGRSITTDQINIQSGFGIVGLGAGVSGLHGVGNFSGNRPILRGASGSVATPYVDNVFADFEIDGIGMDFTIYNVALKGLYIGYMVRPIMRGLYVHDTPATGIGTDFLQDYRITDNIVVNCGRLNNGTTDPGGSGIGIATGSTLEEGGIISGNTVRGSKRFGIFLESNLNNADSRRHRIIGNYCATNKDGIGLTGEAGTVVEGNQCIANTRYGIVSNGGTLGSGITGWESIITANLCADNTSHGIYFDGSAANGTATKRARVIYAGNQSIRNGGDGLHIDITTKDLSWFRVVDNRFNDNTGYGVQINQPSGTGVLDKVRILNNSLQNNTAGAYNRTVAVAEIEARGNAGLNPQGPAAITVTASPFTYTAGDTPEVVYIDGGTVSAVAKAATTLRASTGVQVQLAAKESVTVTYSAAPTMVADRQ